MEYSRRAEKQQCGLICIQAPYLNLVADGNSCKRHPGGGEFIESPSSLRLAFDVAGDSCGGCRKIRIDWPGESVGLSVNGPR